MSFELQLSYESPNSILQVSSKIKIGLFLAVLNDNIAIQIRLGSLVHVSEKNLIRVNSKNSEICFHTNPNNFLVWFYVKLLKINSIHFNPWL